MAINLLRRVGHMISGVGGIVASLSPFRQSLDSSDEIDTGNQIPGLSNLQRSLGNTFVEEVSSASANIFDAEQFHGDVECDDNFANANSGHGRSSRKEYWDRVKGIECITSDLSAGCKCGLNCCHSMTIGAVLRCRFYLYLIQIREQLFQCLSNYSRYDLRQRAELRELRLAYKQGTWRERSCFYRERALAANYPEENLSAIIDGAAQE